MTKYAKIPLVVDAVQWNGKNFKAIEALLGPNVASIEDHLGLVVFTGRISQLVIMGSFIVKEHADANPQILSQFKFENLYSPIKKK